MNNQHPILSHSLIMKSQSNIETPKKSHSVGHSFSPLQDITNQHQLAQTLPCELNSLPGQNKVNSIDHGLIPTGSKSNTMQKMAININKWLSSTPVEINHGGSAINSNSIGHPLNDIDLSPDDTLSHTVQFRSFMLDWKKPEKMISAEEKVKPVTSNQEGRYQLETSSNMEQVPNLSTTISSNHSKGSSKIMFNEEEIVTTTIEETSSDHWQEETLALSNKVNLLESRNRGLLEKQEKYHHLMDEYEKMIASLEASKYEIDLSTSEGYRHKLTETELANTRLTKENQQLTSKLQKLQSKYERLETINEEAAKNESISKSALEKVHHDLITSEAQFVRLRTYAQEQLDKANTEISRLREENLQTKLLLTAKLSRAETLIETKLAEHDLWCKEISILKSIIHDLCKQSVSN